MTTFYVLYNPADKFYIAQGHGVRYTYTPNNAKHFTSEFMAQRFAERNECSGFAVRKITRF